MIGNFLEAEGTHRDTSLVSQTTALPPSLTSAPFGDSCLEAAQDPVLRAAALIPALGRLGLPGC